MRVLLLRLEAPLMSFGTTTVDDNGPTARFPALSMVAGLLANALGYDHLEPERTQALQDRLTIASLLLREGDTMVDYQTAEVGFGDTLWSTRGEPEERAGHANTYRGPVLRRRHYLADASVRVAAVLAGGEGPDPEALVRALRRPARPLFIGRRPCLPTRPVFLDLTEADRPLEALGRLGSGPAQWPDAAPGPSPSRQVAVTDLRDWRSRLHVGQRLVREGRLPAGWSSPC